MRLRYSRCVSGRALVIHAFGSVRGGVGKSTLAVVTAKRLAARGRVPVVVEADMLGASLAAGLTLRAPDVATRDGLIDLEAAPTGRWHSFAQTQQLRRARAQWQHQHLEAVALAMPPPPFLDDALFYPVPNPPRECSVAALLWRHEHDDGVWYLPSSSLPADVERIVPYDRGSAGEFHWIRRMTFVLDGLLEQKPELTDVVIDLPCGTEGLAHEVMALLGALDRAGALPRGFPAWAETLDIRINPFIVTSHDRNDHVLAVDHFVAARKHVPSMALLVNRVDDRGLESVRQQILEAMPPTPRDGAPILRFIPARAQSLGRIFSTGDVSVERDDRARLDDALRLESAP